MGRPGSFLAASPPECSHGGDLRVTGDKTGACKGPAPSPRPPSSPEETGQFCLRRYQRDHLDENTYVFNEGAEEGII